MALAVVVIADLGVVEVRHAAGGGGDGGDGRRGGHRHFLLLFFGGMSREVGGSLLRGERQ